VSIHGVFVEFSPDVSNLVVSGQSTSSLMSHKAAPALQKARTATPPPASYNIDNFPTSVVLAIVFRCPAPTKTASWHLHMRSPQSHRGSRVAIPKPLNLLGTETEIFYP
jgi:hypothetical protein